MFFKLSLGSRMADKAQDLQDLISLSRAMLEKAREKSWDDVVVLEAERSELIRLFFLGPVQQEYAEAVADGIQLMISIDNDIMELGALKRFDLAQTLKNMEQGKKAVKAYTA
jgi:predicted TPR repeat methyltransferase